MLKTSLTTYNYAGEEEFVYPFPSADPYLVEDRAFLQAVASGDSSGIQSSYSDAAKTYKLSWDIRRASEVLNNYCKPHEL